jgi:hypothetical protein
MEMLANLIQHNFLKYPSSYLIILLWGTMGFGFQPSFGAFIVHFIIAPAIMLLGQALAHWEGRREGKADAHVDLSRRPASNG